MPAFLTHMIGADNVLKRLENPRAKKLITEHPDAYHSGAQGGDYFYLYKYYSMWAGYSYKLFGYENHLSPDDHFQDVKRIIAACPNCCAYLEEHSAQAGLDIEVVPLPKALKDAGCEISLPLFAEGPLAVHDSCPDRETGRYAESIRSLLKPEDYVEMEHNRAHSHCCGSKVLAAGKEEAAQKLAGARIAEAQDANARGIVTACMSCTSLLSACSESTPVYHYLELLYGHRIPWKSTSQLLAVQFLLDENRPASGTYYVARP